MLTTARADAVTPVPTPLPTPAAPAAPAAAPAGAPAVILAGPAMPPAAATDAIAPDVSAGFPLRQCERGFPSLVGTVVFYINNRHQTSSTFRTPQPPQNTEVL